MTKLALLELINDLTESCYPVKLEVYEHHVIIVECVPAVLHSIINRQTDSYRVAIYGGGLHVDFPSGDKERAQLPE
jgi:hypothetical protein